MVKHDSDREETDQRITDQILVVSVDPLPIAAREWPGQGEQEEKQIDQELGQESIQVTYKEMLRAYIGRLDEWQVEEHWFNGKVKQPTTKVPTVTDSSDMKMFMMKIEKQKEMAMGWICKYWLQ